MSTAYRAGKKIKMNELFDGRLKKYGVREKVVEGKTTQGCRLLIDDSGSLWIHGDENFQGASRYGLGNSPRNILSAIEAVFNTKLYSEHESQYWGFETKEEWERAWDEMYKQQQAEFYLEVMSYVNGLPNSIEPGTIGMLLAEIAEELIAESPALLSPEHEEELMQEIHDRYFGIDVGSCCSAMQH